MRNKFTQALTRTKKRTNALVNREQNDVIPRITNETIASQREEVLGGARKYIYPLQHSKHRIVLISGGIFIALILTFLVFTVLSLYRFQSTNTFMYRISQVLPLPVARQGSNFISYENYLFELRHYMHYYETQQKLSFGSESGRQQLENYKQRAIDKVINDALIKNAAAEKGLVVTDKELDRQIELARDQNRLGSSNQVFEDVLREYWGWTVRDYRRSLRSELLAQEVAANLDQEALSRSKEAAGKITTGTDFATVAKEFSADEETKEAGGEFGVVDRSDRNLSPQSINILFSLQATQTSEPIVVPYGGGVAYEILKSMEVQGEKVRGAHVVIPIRDINEYLNDQKEKSPIRQYIRIKAETTQTP